MDLQRIGPKDLVRLLVDTFHSERFAEELAGKIAVNSDGNPYFVFEIIRGLEEGPAPRCRPMRPLENGVVRCGGDPLGCRISLSGL
jgi:hypothetical protein